MYVVDEVNGGSVAAFDLLENDKELKAIAGSPYQVTCPGFCTSNPDDVLIGGSYLYSIDTYGWYISAFSIAKSGALTELDSYATGEGPTDAVMTPDGGYLYVTDGALVALKGSPFADGSGTGPTASAIDSAGKELFVANQSVEQIAGDRASGAMTQIKGSPFTEKQGAEYPRSLAIY